MSIVVFASTTHDFYFEKVALPPELAPLLKHDGQGIVYITIPHAEFYEKIRAKQPIGGSEAFGVPAEYFLPLSKAKVTNDYSTGKGANPAAVACVLGSDVTLYGALGDDAYSKKAVTGLTRLGVHTKMKMIVGMTMAHAHIFIQDVDTQLSVIYKGTNNLADQNFVSDGALNDRTTLLINTSVPLGETRALLARAGENGVQRIVFNCTKAAGLQHSDFKYVTDIVINRAECVALADHFNMPFDEDCDASLAGVLSDTLKLRCVMTRGGDSVLIAHGRHVTEVFPNPITPVDVTGAGDGFLGTYLAGIDQGKDIVQTVKEAIVVGGMIAAHKGPRYVGFTAQEVTQQSAAIRATPAKNSLQDGIRSTHAHRL